MIVIGAIFASTLIVISLVFAGIVSRLVRAHSRERDLLINQVMHLSGKTWSPPPRNPEEYAQAVEDIDSRYTFTPAFDDIDE